MPTTALSLPVTTHGRFLVRTNTGPLIGLLVGFHGYAQDAESALSEIDRIDGSEQWLAVSIQGLHRFYGRGGKDVVSSWMTSQDRDQAIADNVAYVRAVVDHVRRTCCASSDGPSRLPIVVAGFSQGVAMAFRSAVHLTPSAGIIALGGDIPPDIRSASIRLPPVLLGRGTRDAWYSAEKLESDKAWLAAAGADFTVSLFDGGHEWSDAFREAAASFLSRRLVSPPPPR
jgi:predicted esterase